MGYYKQVYIDAFGFDEGDWIPCEISGQTAVDIHHIIGRGKGGEDRIENLMALTREIHAEFGDIKECMVTLLQRHRAVLVLKRIKFDREWFRQQIKHYKQYE